MATCSHYIKSLLGSVLFLIALFNFAGCSNDQSQVNNVVQAQIKPNTDLTKENDKQFLVRAVEMKYEQILLGKLVQQRSATDEIRQLAKMLEEANREEKSSLASLGIMKSIAVPSTPTKLALDGYAKLNEASVEDIDFAYLGQVVLNYNDQILLFENATRENLDQDIQSKALSMLPDMRNYLSKVRELNAHMNPVSELVQ